MEITLPRRFRGPLTSANGGYASGRLAAFVDSGAVEVTLRLPPRLDRPLEVRVEGDTTLLLDGEALVAEARAASLEVEAPRPISVSQADAAAARHVRVGDAAFGECFSCGIRAERDGLGVHAGPVSGREPLNAAPWDVREVSPEIVWAAIDCSGAYAVGAAGRGDVVLGRMTARIHALPAVGDRCVVAAWPLGHDGRKLYAGTSLFSADGGLLALARQTWIEPRSQPS
jgi:hypothetical protein